jgi:type I restriction enzyme S subunit
LGHQNEIVEYLDFIHKSIDSSNQKIAELKQLNAYYLNHQAKFGKNEIKSLDKVCVFLPKSKRQASYGEEIGEFPFYTSSQTLNKYSSSSDYKDLCLIIGTGGNANIKIDSNFSCSTDNFVLKTNSDILTKYIYYYLYINISILQNEFYGATIKHISKSTIESINIPIPPLDQQTKIIQYCEQNDLLIAQLENTIESNKTAAKEFLTMVISSSVEAVNTTEN